MFTGQSLRDFFQRLALPFGQCAVEVRLTFSRSTGWLSRYLPVPLKVMEVPKGAQKPLVLMVVGTLLGSNPSASPRPKLIQQSLFDIRAIEWGGI